MIFSPAATIRGPASEGFWNLMFHHDQYVSLYNRVQSELESGTYASGHVSAHTKNEYFNAISTLEQQCLRKVTEDVRAAEQENIRCLQIGFEKKKPEFQNSPGSRYDIEFIFSSTEN